MKVKFHRKIYWNTKFPACSWKVSQNAEQEKERLKVSLVDTPVHLLLDMLMCELQLFSSQVFHQFVLV